MPGAGECPASRAVSRLLTASHSGAITEYIAEHVSKPVEPTHLVTIVANLAGLLGAT